MCKNKTVMNANEKWNLIVSLMQEHRFDKEDKIQELWQSIFADANFFGYSQFGGEIDSQRQMPIGSRERTIPDIIIRDSVNNRDLFVVELKQHNLPFQKKYMEQLFSYMRLLRLSIGVLVCDEIYLYYLDNNDVQKVIAIPFEYDENDGKYFVELLSKGSFDQQKVCDFITKHHEFNEHVKAIEQDLSQLNIKKLIEKHYQNQYTKDEIDTVLSKIQIDIKFQETIKISEPISDNNPTIIKHGIGKNEAISLFRNHGYQISKNVTFASRNKSGYRYWANPKFTNLNQEWWLILNDNINCKLCLFQIPANTIQKSQLLARHDIPNAIDLQIEYKNPAFKDSRSGYSFAPFYVTEIDY